MLRGKIIGTGSHLPERIVTNFELEKMMDTSDEWIRQRTGIEERRWVDSTKEGTSDLALVAAQKAIANAGIDKEDLDLILFATLSPDHEFPGASSFLQAKLGLVKNVPTIDLRAQCSGFLYSLSIADQFIRTGMYKTIMIIGAEVHSIGLDKTSKGRDISVLFGDGAGAVIVQATDVADAKAGAQILSTHMWAEGAHAQELWLKAPGSGVRENERITQAMIENGDHFPTMNGKKVFVHAIRRMTEALHHVVTSNGYTLNDVDLFLFHQANLRINESIAEKNGIPADKLFNTIQKTGNTTAATLPICTDWARSEGKLKEGMLVAYVAFGSGFTWSSALVRF